MLFSFLLAYLTIKHYLWDKNKPMKRYLILLMLYTAMPCCTLCQNPAAGDSAFNATVRQAIDLLHMDSMEAARIQFLEALRLQPNETQSTLIYRYIAQIEEQQGKSQQALETYTAGINKMPQNEQLLLDRAALLYRMGQNARAANDYNSALDINAKCQEALFMRAHIRYEERDYSGARRDYETLIRLAPDRLDARCGLALTNDRSGRAVEAMGQMNALIELYPREAMLYALRGGMRQRRRQYEQALADLSYAIELSPQTADYYVSRATLYLELGNRKMARQDTRMATELGADAREMAGLLKK